jgi:beta-phosphoglucomutase-like phosphatase (HAD superfamily)
MKLVALLGFLAMQGACDDRSATRHHNNATEEPVGKDKDVRDALVLDAALDKAQKELAALEAAQPRDEDAIAKKRRAIKAVTETLERLRKRVDDPSQPK